MLGRNLAFLISLSFLSLSFSAMAADLDHSVAGDSNLEDVIGADKEVSGESPYIINGEPANTVENSKAKGADYIFNHGVQEVSDKITSKKQFQDVGYTPPGTFENQENYLEIDKVKMARDIRKGSSGGMNITFFKDNYDYQSTNDIINRTVTTGSRSIKGGALYFRNDSYIYRTSFMNFHWSVGAGVGYNSGKGFFIDGTRSDTTFNLWEVPVDLGAGLEIPIGTWAKLAGTGGPSVLGLMQNRSDFQRGEKGKRKFQYSPGYFANAQVKINLTGLSEEAAYNLFTTSDITNLFMNFEMRYQSYSNFQDAISISGTSFGVGFTFEYL